MSVNWTAAEGFGRAAAAYERGRPGYPQAAIDWMVGQLGITPVSTTIDLGAGTGKFSRMMRSTGARVIAIEPVAAMRVELANAVPGVQVLDVEGLVDRVLSISFIATLPDDERATVADQVRALVDQTPITLPYLTDVYLFRRR